MGWRLLNKPESAQQISGPGISKAAEDCVALLCVMVFVCYAYTPFVTRMAPPAVAHGVMRIIASLLICIGVQIAWHGMSGLLVSAIR